MKIFKLLLAACLTLSYAQVQAQKFETSYPFPGNEKGNDIAELSDGSIITVGTSNSYGAGGNDLVVMKTTASGTLLWVKYFGDAGDDGGTALSIGPADEIYAGGFTMVGTDKQALILKLDKNGALAWSNIYGGAGTDQINDLGIRSNKLYAVGTTSSAGAGNSDMWFLKIDTAGIIIQNKTVGFTGSEEANALSFTTDGNLVMAGRTTSFTGYNVFAAKVNLSGDSLWTRKFNLYLGTGTSSTPSGAGIAELTNQDLVITGVGWDGIGNYPSTYHLRISSSGTTVYTKWTSFLSDVGLDVVAGKNGSYYLLIGNDNFGARIAMKKFNNSGTETLSIQYQYPGGTSYSTFSNGSRMRVISGSKLLITGVSYLSNGNADIYIARLDSNGVAYTTPAPVIVASGPLTFCAGNSIILSVPAGYSRYSWAKITQNQLIYLNNDNDSLVVNSGGTYYCTMWNSAGNRISSAVLVTVNPQAAATISASGTTSYCSGLGQSVVLTAPSGYLSYQWSLNGSPIGSAVTNSYTPSGSGSYTVTMTNTCGTSTSTPTVVNANTPPVSAISCSGFNCYGGFGPCGTFPDNLIVTNYGTNATYEWYNNGILYSTGSNTLSPGYTAGNYTCTITTPCGSSTSPVFNVVQGPGPNVYLITANGQATGCGVPSSVVLNAPYQATSSIQWFVNGLVISGANNPTFTATVSGTYTVEFYEANCFTTQYSDPFTLQLNTPVSAITAPSGTSVCSGTLPLSATPVGAGITYQWYRGNSPIVGAQSATYSAAVTGVYKCYINNPACGSGFSNEITLNIGVPVSTIAIGYSTICSGSTTNVYYNPGYGNLYTYQWKLNNTPIGGAINSTYSAGQAGSYTCVATNGCGSVTSNAVSLSVNPLPPSTITYSGGTTLCSGQSKTLTAPAGTGYTYQWYKNNSNLFGYTAQTYSATTAGTYVVRVVSPSGCSSTTNPGVVLTAETAPVASIKSTDYPQICSGNSLLLKTVSGSYSYQWIKNGITINGAIDSVYGVTTAGTYTVSLTNICGASISSGLNVVVKAKPSAVITPSGSLSFCSGDSVTLQANAGNKYSYYWRKGGTLIAGADAADYVAKTAGWYKVGVVTQYGCIRESSGVTVSVPCREDGSMVSDEILENGFQVFPNPSSGDFTIQFDESIEGIVLMECTDIQGRVIQPEFSNISSSAYSLRGLTAGVYILRVTSADRIASLRIVKL